MGKQFRITKNAGEPLNVDLLDTEEIRVVIEHMPSPFTSGLANTERVLIAGARALGEDAQAVHWHGFSLAVNERVTVELIESARAGVPPVKTEDFPGIGNHCSFCEKAGNEVRHLIAAAQPVTYICDECILECQRLIDEKSAI